MGVLAEMRDEPAKQQDVWQQDDEGLLLTRHLQGDTEAFAELVARFGSLVWSSWWVGAR